MKRIAIFGMSIFLLVIGVTLGYYLGISTRNPNDFDWQELSINPSEKGYGFTSEALFNSDVALPDIKRLSGKTKFLSPVKSDRHELHLGYIVSVDVEKLKLEQLPEKYKEEREVKSKRGGFTIMPFQGVGYQVSFEFSLKDKDGFELIKLESPKHSIYSGKDNRFQDKVSQLILKTVAERTKDIVLQMTVEKCETCT